MTSNPPIRMYENKAENRITFKVMTEYYLQPVTLETMKLPRSTKNKTNKEKQRRKRTSFRN